MLGFFPIGKGVITIDLRVGGGGVGAGDPELLREQGRF
jgi:hypothetical protein